MVRARADFERCTHTCPASSGKGGRGRASIKQMGWKMQELRSMNGNCPESSRSWVWRTLTEAGPSVQRLSWPSLPSPPLPRHQVPSSGFLSWRHTVPPRRVAAALPPYNLNFLVVFSRGIESSLGYFVPPLPEDGTSVNICSWSERHPLRKGLRDVDTSWGVAAIPEA